MTSTRFQFARRLRELRITKGFAKARHFAASLGIGENRYTRYERGTAEPSLDMIVLVCKKLGVSPNDLFGAEAGEHRFVPAAFAERTQQAFRHGDDAAALSATAHPGPTISPPPANTDDDAWRAARELAGYRLRSGAGLHAGEDDPMAELRETAGVFRELRADPYRTIAQFLALPSLAAQPRKVQQHLNAEINRFLSSIDCAAPRK